MKRASESLFIFLLLLSVALTSVAQNADYKTLTDIPYYREDIREKDPYINERCRLDIYYPTDRKDFATIVWFHGGGLTGGNKELQGYSHGMTYPAFPLVLEEVRRINESN